MGKSLLDKIQAKLELLRLEKRYTRSRHRRSAFVSNAIYVDGEYVFQTPNTTGSSSATSSSVSGIDALHGDLARPEPPVARVVAPPIEEDEEDERAADRRMDDEFQREQLEKKQQQRKRFHRFSTAPVASPRDVDFQTEEVQRKRLNRYSSMPGFGSGYDVKTAPRVQERRLSMIR